MTIYVCAVFCDIIQCYSTSEGCVTSTCGHSSSQSLWKYVYHALNPFGQCQSCDQLSLPIIPTYSQHQFHLPRSPPPDERFCERQNPCTNNGTCRDVGPNQYQCDCPYGYNGTNCNSSESACVVWWVRGGWVL